VYGSDIKSDVDEDLAEPTTEAPQGCRKKKVERIVNFHYVRYD